MRNSLPLAFLLLPMVTSSCPVGWAELPPLGTRCYYINLTPATFLEADNFCKEMNGRLISLHNGFENQVFKDFLTYNSSIEILWIGYTDLWSMDGQWQWIDGTPTNYVNTCPGFPSNTDNHCAKFQSRGCWADADCSSRSQFICTTNQSTSSTTTSTTTAMTNSVNPSPIPCPDDFVLLDDGRCYLYVGERKRFADARNDCLARGADLASVHNAWQNLMLASMVAIATGVGNDVWIGAVCQNRYPYDDECSWTDGTPFDYYYPDKLNCRRAKNDSCYGVQSSRSVGTYSYSYWDFVSYGFYDWSAYPYVCTIDRKIIGDFLPLPICNVGFFPTDVLDEQICYTFNSRYYGSPQRAVSIHSAEANAAITTLFRSLNFDAQLNLGYQFVFYATQLKGRRYISGVGYVGEMQWLDGSALDYVNFWPENPTLPEWGGVVVVRSIETDGGDINTWMSITGIGAVDDTRTLYVWQQPVIKDTFILTNSCTYEVPSDYPSEIRSFDYPVGYKNNLNCSYRIPGSYFRYRRQLYFIEFDLDRDGDYVELSIDNSDPIRLTGQEGKGRTYDGTMISLRFVTNSITGNRPGWRAYVTELYWYCPECSNLTPVPSISSTGACPTDFTLLDDGICYFYGCEKKSFIDARQDCLDRGAELAQLSNAWQNKILDNFIIAVMLPFGWVEETCYAPVWLGATCTCMDEYYNCTWLDGSVLELKRPQRCWGSVSENKTMCVMKYNRGPQNDWTVLDCDNPYNGQRYVCAAKTLTETEPILPHCNVGFAQGSEGFCFQMNNNNNYFPFSIQSEEENTALLHFVKQTLNDNFYIYIPLLRCYFENRTLLWFDGDEPFEANYTNFSPLSQRCPTFDDSGVVMDSSGQWLWSTYEDMSFPGILVNRQPVLEKFFVDSPSCEYPIMQTNSGYGGEIRSTVYPNGYDINMTCAYIFYIPQGYRVSVYFIDVDIADGQDFIQLIHGNGTVVTALTGREGKGRTFVLYGSESRLRFVAGQIASNATGWRAFYISEWIYF